MHYDRSPSNVICTAMPLGWQSGMDLTASVSLIADSADMRRSWNGRIRNFADAAFRLFRIELSSGDGEMKTPPLTRLMPGDEFEMVLFTDFEDFIPTGGTTRTLIRTPHAASITCKDLGWSDIDFSISGKVLTLTAPAATPVRISYRPVLEVAVVEPVKWSEREQLKEVDWTVVVEEVGSDG